MCIEQLDDMGVFTQCAEEPRPEAHVISDDNAVVETNRVGHHASFTTFFKSCTKRGSAIRRESKNLSWL